MNTLIRWGYWGLFLGSFLASTILPLSSDILYAGVLLIGANPWLSLFIVTAGNWLGGLTTYGLGYLGKWEWLEKYFKVKPEQLESQKELIDKYGSLLAFFTWLPFAGDVFMVAMGFYKVNPKKSMLYSLIGRFVKFLLWTLLYLKFGQKFIDLITLV